MSTVAILPHFLSLYVYCECPLGGSLHIRELLNIKTHERADLHSLQLQPRTRALVYHIRVEMENQQAFKFNINHSMFGLVLRHHLTRLVISAWGHYGMYGQAHWRAQLLQHCRPNTTHSYSRTSKSSQPYFLLVRPFDPTISPRAAAHTLLHISHVQLTISTTTSFLGQSAAPAPPVSSPPPTCPRTWRATRFTTNSRRTVGAARAATSTTHSPSQPWTSHSIRRRSASASTSRRRCGTRASANG